MCLNLFKCVWVCVLVCLSVLGCVLECLGVLGCVFNCLAVCLGAHRHLLHMLEEVVERS